MLWDSYATQITGRDQKIHFINAFLIQTTILCTHTAVHCIKLIDSSCFLMTCSSAAAYKSWIFLMLLYQNFQFQLKS